jgi:hypothetical protein
MGKLGNIHWNEGERRQAAARVRVPPFGAPPGDGLGRPAPLTVAGRILQSNFFCPTLTWSFCPTLTWSNL